MKELPCFAFVMCAAHFLRPLCCTILDPPLPYRINNTKCYPNISEGSVFFSFSAHSSAIYFCIVVSTVALLLALAALWRARLGNTCRSETTDLEPPQTAKDDKCSSSCSRAYEMVDHSGPELQENQIYHISNNQTTHETSLDPQQCPSTSSQANVLPEYDQTIPKDMKPDDQQYNHGSFYHVIDLL